MKGPYLEGHEMKQLEELMKHVAEDTIGCWIRTRVNGSSASLACEGNISLILLRELDKKITPLLDESEMANPPKLK